MLQPDKEGGKKELAIFRFHPDENDQMVLDDINGDAEYYEAARQAEALLKEEAESSEREYVPLDLSGEKKAEEGEKIIGDVSADKDNIVKESDEKQSDAKEFKFTDLSSDNNKDDKKDSNKDSNK